MNLKRSTVLLILPFSALANTSLLPATNYNTNIGGKPATIGMHGNLNYIYGVNDSTSHWKNSWLALTSGIDLTKDISVTSVAGVEHDYRVKQDDYNEVPYLNVKVDYNALQIDIGHSNYILDKVLPSSLVNYLDVNRTQNPIGLLIADRGTYGRGVFTYQDLEVGLGIDNDGYPFLTGSKYLTSPNESSDVKFIEFNTIIYDHKDSGSGMFFNLRTELHDSVGFNFGFGKVADKSAYLASADYVINDSISVSGGVIGSNDYSQITTQAEYYYKNIVSYMSIGHDLNENYLGDKNTKLGIGVNLVF